MRDTWDGARAEFLVWVATGDRLSDRRIVEFARAWRDRFPETAVGIIAARTLEEARALWRRGAEARPAPAASFNPFAPISRKRFLNALSTHGYVTYAGHGGPTHFNLGSARIAAAQLPPMSGLVIGTESCNVFRPWTPDSIALAFSLRGADPRTRPLRFRPSAPPAATPQTAVAACGARRRTRAGPGARR